MVSGAKRLIFRAHQRKFSATLRKPKLAIVFAVCGALFVFLLSMALVAHRSSKADQNQPFVLSRERLAEFTSLEPIDAHTHVTQTGPAFVGMLERLHMHVLDILYVDDTDQYRTSMEPQKQDALKFVASSMGHAQLCTTFDPFGISRANFSRGAIDALNLDFAHGAVAAKIWKNIGMEIKSASGQYVMPDDLRFEPIYQDIAAHHKTLVAHTADPDVAWQSQDPKAAHLNYYVAHPEWLMSRKPGAPGKETILRARDHLLAMNPDLRVVGAHLGSMEYDLDGLATRLELFPNFAVDTANTMRKLETQPRNKVRAFILKYQDRILFGTDLRFDSGTTDQGASETWANEYALEWRFFATEDTFEHNGRKIEGLNLPRSVLKKLYHDNAVHWIPGIDANAL